MEDESDSAIFPFPTAGNEFVSNFLSLFRSLGSLFRGPSSSEEESPSREITNLDTFRILSNSKSI